MRERRVDLSGGLKKDSKAGDLTSPDNCNACGSPLNPNALYCEWCGPPESFEDDSGNDLSGGQTFLRIAVVALLFVAAAVYKLDIEVDLLGWKTPRQTGHIPAAEQPKDTGFRMVHIVNAPLANVRKAASRKSPIVMVLVQGTRVDILEKKKRWSRISAEDTTGWIANGLLTAKVE